MTLWEYFNAGGSIMYILLLFNIVGVALIITKFWLLHNRNKQIESIATELYNLVKLKFQNRNKEELNILSRQEIADYMSQQESGLNTIKIIAVISPLLGLLGTVVGILLAFEVMAATGMANPADFAKGIYLALITTVGGLVVAIPHYIAHSYLLGYLDKIEVGLEKSVSQRIISN